MKTYRTPDDLASIVSNGITEGVSLEYKSSEIIANRRVANLCKTVTAFANSAGGQFVIGVEAKNGLPVGLDWGVPAPSRRDWIHQVVSNQTSPAVESFEVFEVPAGGGLHYVIDVPASTKAPHQFEGKYYKRRGPHSEPMEHYEIEDVRNRPKTSAPPLRVELDLSQEQLLLLTIRNDHVNETLTNLRLVLTPTFKLDRSGTQKLSERGLRSLRPSSGLSFFLDSAASILQQSPEATLTVKADYDFLGRRATETFVLHIGDLDGSAIVRSPEIEAMNKLIERVDRLVGEMERMRRNNEQLLQMVDGSGLRLSHRTVSAIGNKSVKYNPMEYDAAGYRAILDISVGEAHLLQRIFRGFGRDGRKAYAELPADLRAKVE